MGATFLKAAEKTDAGRVAPIRASVLCLSFVLGEVQMMMCR